MNSKAFSNDHHSSFSIAKSFSRSSRLAAPLVLGIALFAWTGSASSLFAKAPEAAVSPLAKTSAQSDSIGMSRSAVLAAAKKATLKNYPDANQVLIDEADRIHYQKSGAYVANRESYTKVLTEKGRRDALTETMGFDVFYSDLKVTVLEIIKPDGHVVKLDPAQQSKVMIDSSQMSSNIYDPNSKVLTVSIPGVEIGDIVHLATKEVGKHVPMAGTFSDLTVFESTSPIMHMVYQVSGPKSMPLKKIALLNPIGHTVKHSKTSNGDENVYTWTATNVPRYFPEPSMPEISSCGQRVLVSTVPDWKAVSSWYWKISKPHLDQVTEAMRSKVKELTKGAKTKDEKIRDIFDFVSHKVRYMGITTETSSPGFEPHNVDMTFNDRAGVCRDKAALLVSLLRIGGFKAYPVLIMAGDKLAPEVPLPYFNHAITAIQNPDKSFTLMDSTNESTADLFPSYLQNCSYLVATPEGETLHVSPVSPATKNLLTADTTASVNEKGTITGQSVLHFTGINDIAYRGAFVKMKPEDIRRVFEKGIKSRLPGAEITSLEVTPKNLQDTNKPLTVTLHFKAPDFLVSNNGRAFINPPFIGAAFGLAARILEKDTGLAKRRFPIHIGITCGIKEHFTVSLPKTADKVIALPSDEKINTATLLYDRKITQQGSAISGDLNFQILQPDIAVSEYAGMKASLAQMEYAARQKPILATANSERNGADIRILSEKTNYDVKNAHTWNVTKIVREKILTYAGKKENSELHLHYNPVWTSLKLNYARVVLADGTVKNVKPQDKNLMDAKWVSSAPRYPAGKQLVVSLPGVEIGSTIEYSVTYENKGRPFFSASSAFASFNPVDQDSVSVSAPASLKLAFKQNADVAVKKENGVTDYSVTKSYPAIPHETSLPPAHTFAPYFQLSSIASDADYAKIVADAVQPLAKPTKAIEAKAAKLVQNCKTAAEKVTAIRNFVAQQIREAGPDFAALPLSSLSHAETTLKEGYGNSADRAILLQSLLAAANLKSALFLTTEDNAVPLTREKNAPLQSGYYSQLVVRAMPDGNPVWLDQLSQYATAGTTGLEHAVALPLSGGAPFVIKPAPSFLDRSETSYTMSIQPNGDALITVARHFPGKYFTAFKQKFSEMTPEQLKQFHQEALTALSQGAVAASKITTDFAYPGTLKYSARIKRYAVKTGAYLYFDLPGKLSNVVDAHDDSRKEAFFQSDTNAAQRHWNIVLPKDFAISALPQPYEWQGPGKLGGVAISHSQKTDAKGNAILHFAADVNIQPAIVPAGSYQSLLDVNQRLSQPAAWRILLKKGNPVETAKTADRH